MDKNWARCPKFDLICTICHLVQKHYEHYDISQLILQEIILIYLNSVIYRQPAIVVMMTQPELS